MTPPARAGINALFLRPGMGGLETYVNELVGELVRIAPGMRLTLLAGDEGRELLGRQPWAGEVSFRTPPVLSRPGLRMLTEVSLLGWLASETFDVLHSPALTAPLLTTAANVVVLADVTWIVAPTGGADVVMTERAWRAVVPAIARRADRVVAISRDGAGQIAEHLRVPPRRIDVIPLGASPRPAVTAAAPAELRAALGLGDGPVVLNVGAKKRHKNQAALVRAMPSVRAAHPTAQLVLAGAPTEYEQELRGEVARLGLEAAVTFCGYVSQEQLEGLYSLATCFAFPSLSEGFGLPILEAMERGLPVACSDVSAMPEVAGEAALLFDPRDDEAVAQALIRLLGDAALRELLAGAGRARKRLFSWRTTAERTIDCWERAVAARRGKSQARSARR